MTVLTFTLIMLLGAFLAGFIGSLSGLGGGIIIIPLLTILLGVDIHYAIGAALVSVIATSSGSAAAYVKEGITNMRLGIFLEVATTIGAVCGALIATIAPTSFIAVLFGLTLIFSSNLKLQSSNLKKMTLQIPNHTIKIAVQNSKSKFNNKAIIKSLQILQVSSKTVAKAVCEIDHRIISL